ncbi:hypothetical protein EYR38_007042 [Pleurotus pulmonarius]|nr:hypothetical protein EYR38_007042 [Pleurotus pulmonarius]
MMPILPPEIWHYIASFIPDRQLSKLYSVNRIFLELALAAKYGTIDVDPSTIMPPLERLQISLEFIKYIIWLAVNRQSRASFISRIFTKLGIKSAQDPYLRSVQKTLLAIIPLLKNIREYSIFWDPQIYDEPIGGTRKTNRDAPGTWIGDALARTFRQIPLLLAPTLQNLSSLEIAIVSGYWTFTTGEWNRKSLASLLSLVNGLAPTLEELSIAPPAPYDLKPFFEGLGRRERSSNFGMAANCLIFTGHFPHLRHLSVREPIDGIHMSDIAIFQKFIDSHRGTLKGLTLGADTHSNFGYSETSWVPRLFQPISPIPLTSLHLGLLYHTDALKPVFEQITRFCVCLRSLKVTGAMMNYDELSLLATALSAGFATTPIPLHELWICITDLDKPVIDLLAAQFPLLKKLSIRISALGMKARSGMFISSLKGIQYTEWKVTDISVRIDTPLRSCPSRKLEHAIMEVLALAIPSIKRFNGAEVVAIHTQVAELTTFELVA